MFHLTRVLSSTIVLAALAVLATESQGDDALPLGRVGVHGFDQFVLRGNNALLQSWEFLSPDGVLEPDPDSDASPWQIYLSNSPTLVHAASSPANSVLVNYTPLDVGLSSFGWGQFDFWYTNADGQRVPGPIFPLSAPEPDVFELVADIRDGSLKIVRKTSKFEGNWTYSYSIATERKGRLSPDSDGNATPYLTYLSNSESLIAAATSNAVVIEDSLLLDAKFARKGLVFWYEILGPEPTLLTLAEGAVRYIPEPCSVMLFCNGVLSVLTARPNGRHR